MSRRVKLIIAGIFHVLIAIPVAYVVLTWSTPNPLRFHIVAYHPPGSSKAWEREGKLDLRVENTSHLPVHLYLPTFGRGDLPEGSVPVPRDPFASMGSGLSTQDFTELRATIPPSMITTLFIPPGGSASCPCRVIMGEETPPITWEYAEVRYQWYSGTRNTYAYIWGWLYERLPERVMAYLLSPDCLTDTTELVPASP